MGLAFRITGSLMIEYNTWPGYMPEEIPPDAPPGLKHTMNELNTISRKIRVSVDTYYLFKTIMQRRAFAEAVNGSPIAYATRVVAGAVTRDLVISLASIFDSNNDAINLKRVVNSLLNPKHVEILRRFHATWPAPYDTNSGIKKLLYWQNKIRKGNLSNAIQKISDLRNKAVAHVDLDPEFKHGRVQVWEIEYIIVGASSIVLIANQFAAGRIIDAAQLRQNSRQAIACLTNSIIAGANHWRFGQPEMQT